MYCSLVIILEKNMYLSLNLIQVDFLFTNFSEYLDNK